MTDTHTFTPAVSVVVASGAGGEFLFRCLASLRSQVRDAGAELIVVDRTGESTRARIRREFPKVTVIPVSPEERPSVPRMRRIGVEAGRARIVVVLEEHCTAPEGWVRAIADSFRADDAAIGGPILDSGFTTRRDWCVYFSEYHNYLPPWDDGERYELNGANIAYDRTRLMRYRDLLDTGYWEVVLHPKLVQDGKFRAVEAMGACHTGPFPYRYYLRQRYLLSRSWGGAARTTASWPKRIAHLLAGPLLPAFLFLRVTSRVVEKRRYLWPYVSSLPLLIPAWCSYAWGEWLGYLVGPGRALEEVE